MSRFILGRLAQGAVVLLGVTVAAFLLIHLAPGDPARTMLGIRATPEAVAELRAQLGLDRSILTQYGDFLAGAVTLDFGESIFQGAPVADLIWPRLWASAQLIALGTVVALLLALPLGIWSAVRHNGLPDHVVRVATMVVFAMPPFWMGLLLVVVFSVELRWLPSSGYGDGGWERLETLLLPSLALGLTVAPLLVRTLRSSLIETLDAPFVETARARGLSERRVLVKHALRASLISTVTVLGVMLATLLGGLVVIETVFDVPGVGSLLTQAVQGRDFPIVQAIVFICGAAVVLVNLLTDVAYAAIDPRVRLR